MVILKDVAVGCYCPHISSSSASAFMSTFHRSLATLGLPSGLVASLITAGYETVGDLANTSEAELLSGPLFLLLIRITMD